MLIIKEKWKLINPINFFHTTKEKEQKFNNTYEIFKNPFLRNKHKIVSRNM